MNKDSAHKPASKKRQHFAKTRTGCVTCKIRRVKCDETKPECTKCTGTGRKCDGYAQDVSVRPYDHTQASSSLPAALSRLSGNTQEKRGFQFFVAQTAAELSGFYASSFWERLILQVSSSDPVLRHAIVALGAVHEEFTAKRLITGGGSTSEDKSFAAQQYGKAIGQLRRSLGLGKQTLLTALLACILFVSYDSLRGNFQAAILHIESGLKMLGEYKNQSAADVHIIENAIMPLFMRLIVQAIIFMDTRTTPVRRAFVEKLQTLRVKDEELIPDEFETLDEARVALDRAADGLFRAFYVSEPRLPMNCQPEGTYAMFQSRENQLVSWHNAYEKFMNSRSHSMTGIQLRGAVLLKIHHTITKIMAVGVPNLVTGRKIGEINANTAYFQSVTDDFKIIVNLARSLINASEQDAKNSQPPRAFSTELGLIGPLYYACVRCDDKTVREAALELLTRSPRREGMWDSEAAVELVKEFWQIEAMHNSRARPVTRKDGKSVHVTDMVALDLQDGTKMSWKWRNPFTGAPTPYASTPLEGSFDAAMLEIGTPLTAYMFDGLSDVTGIWN